MPLSVLESYIGMQTTAMLPTIASPMRCSTFRHPQPQRGVQTPNREHPDRLLHATPAVQLNRYLSHLFNSQRNSLHGASRRRLFKYHPPRPAIDCSLSRLPLFSRHDMVREPLLQFHSMASGASYINATRQPDAAVSDASDHLASDYSDRAWRRHPASNSLRPLSSLAVFPR